MIFKYVLHITTTDSYHAVPTCLFRSTIMDKLLNPVVTSKSINLQLGSDLSLAYGQINYQNKVPPLQSSTVTKFHRYEVPQ